MSIVAASDLVAGWLGGGCLVGGCLGVWWVGMDFIFKYHCKYWSWCYSRRVGIMNKEEKEEEKEEKEEEDREDFD